MGYTTHHASTHPCRCSQSCPLPPWATPIIRTSVERFFPPVRKSVVFFIGNKFFDLKAMGKWVVEQRWGVRAQHTSPIVYVYVYVCRTVCCARKLPFCEKERANRFVQCSFQHDDETFAHRVNSICAINNLTDFAGYRLLTIFLSSFLDSGAARCFCFGSGVEWLMDWGVELNWRWGHNDDGENIICLFILFVWLTFSDLTDVYLEGLWVSQNKLASEVSNLKVRWQFKSD